MEDTYKTIAKPAEGTFRDRNSRFLAFGYPVDSLARVNEILTGVKKKYHDARHHCYAFAIGPGRETYRLNDDGEPSGTAGKPIYNQLTANELTNLLVIVVRYFGGTLLGTGGLIHAYRSATEDMLNNATVVVKYLEVFYRLSFPYEKLGVVMKVLKDNDIVPGKPVYNEQCILYIAVRKSLVPDLSVKLLAIPVLLTETLQMND